jgi:hypothetical protein
LSLAADFSMASSNAISRQPLSGSAGAPLYPTLPLSTSTDHGCEIGTSPGSNVMPSSQPVNLSGKLYHLGVIAEIEYGRAKLPRVYWYAHAWRYAIRAPTHSTHHAIYTRPGRKFCLLVSMQATDVYHTSCSYGACGVATAKVFGGACRGLSRCER